MGANLLLAAQHGAKPSHRDQVNHLVSLFVLFCLVLYSGSTNSIPLFSSTLYR
jgi:hypothetical protein